MADVVRRGGTGIFGGTWLAAAGPSFAAAVWIQFVTGFDAGRFVSGVAIGNFSRPVLVGVMVGRESNPLASDPSRRTDGII